MKTTLFLKIQKTFIASKIPCLKVIGSAEIEAHIQNIYHSS